MKWILALIVIASFSGLLIGFTDWSWWLCICFSLFAVWCILMVYMTINNIVTNRKKRLLKELERHEKLEERLIEDILSLIELHNYYTPYCSVALPKGTDEKLHQALVDINEYMRHREKN